MKKIGVTVMALTLAIAAKGQDAITKFFDKYSNDQSFTNVNITGRMFGLFTDLEMEDEEDQEVMDAISKLRGLKILAKEDTASLDKNALKTNVIHIEQLSCAHQFRTYVSQSGCYKVHQNPISRVIVAQLVLEITCCSF